jgi:hypothetical protein|tara:strand:- start:600 stop:2105 length:1506 start_codon:yes stop_codon:yes gene_type:complete
MVVPDGRGCADLPPGQQAQQGAATRPQAEEQAQPASARDPSATSVNPKCRALLLLMQRSVQMAVARQREARRLRQRRQRRLRLMLLLLGMRRRLLDKPRRRVIQRTDGGWEASTINNYVTLGDAKTYQLNFRMSKASFDCILEKLSSTGYLTTNASPNPKYRMTAAFKLGVALYFMAGHGRGDMKAVADAASLGTSTVVQYLDKFCRGVARVLRPIYMPSTPPSPENLKSIRAQFASRRGIQNVAMAIDGSHIPYKPQHAATAADFRNYKGWNSILLLGFVNSFHLFVDAEVGACGKSGDNSVLGTSWLMGQIEENPEAWLGPNGVIAGDNGASDGGKRLLNPIPNPTTPEDFFYNFAHSSTRFFVEETFGRFKNRFRFLLYAQDMDHARFNRVVYASVILHNLCTIRKDDALDFTSGADDEWQHFFKEFARDACPSCTRRGVLHCSHTARYRNMRAACGSSAMEIRDAIKTSLWEEMRANNEDVDAVMAELAERAAAQGV